jgi:PiT family inorganic phosphate transporter|tara:strand:+ start:564 stop:2699 length:2136 start_codon:yes stop_codon:yes gene_type:complete
MYPALNMEPIMTVVLILSVAVCAYMAWNIGANDVANAMGTSVGSRALTLKQAVVIAAVFEFLGAFFAGDAVTDTVRKGILTVDFETVTDDFANDLMYGFISAMMAAAIWLTIATRFGLPVSTTHSIIGGIVGIGLVLEVQHSASLIDWNVIRKVVLSWVASPLIGGILAFLTFFIVRILILESVDPIARSRWLAPILAFPTFFTLGLALQFKALKGFIAKAESNGWIENKYDWLPVKENGVFNPIAENAWFPINSLLVSALIGLIASSILWFVLRKYEFKSKGDGFQGVEKIFVWLQIITAAYVAFAHGANDRSNAIGPMAAVYDILSSGGELSSKVDVPLWLVLLGSAGIAVGVMTWGWRVMETIGTKITEITPTRGFAAEFGAATTILIFSMPFLAVPVSTTHTLVGSVVGVGLAGGAKNVNFRVFGKIFASWVASLPAAAFGSVTIYMTMGSDPLKLIVVLPISFLLVGYVMWKTKDDEIHVEDALADAGGDRSSMPTIFELFHSHAVIVEETVEHMLTAVGKATSGKDPSKEIKATIESELRADELKNVLRNKIGESKWKLLINSDEFIYMLGRQDRIADYAQNVAEQLSFRELYDNKQAREMVMEMAESVKKTVSIYEDTVLQLRNLTLSGHTKKDIDKLRDLIHKVNLSEHETDLVESKAAGYVFSEGSDDPLAAVHMYRVLQRLDDVANACEDAANAFLPIVYN